MCWRNRNGSAALPTNGKSKSRWQLKCKGSFSLSDPKGDLVTLHTRKARAVIVFLACSAGKKFSRNDLAHLLWSDHDKSHARANLRQTLLEIRRVAPDLINCDACHLWIDPARLILQSACHDWDLAEQFDDLDDLSPEWDDWLRCHRVTDATQEWTKLKRAAQHKLSRHQPIAALTLIGRMRRISPYDAEWVHLAMLAESAVGRPAGVRAQYEEYADNLLRDLGIAPPSQTRRLHDQLLTELTSDFPRRTFAPKDQHRVIESEEMYFTRRAREERERANEAEHVKARAAHLELAAHYDKLLGAILSDDQHAGDRRSYAASVGRHSVWPSFVDTLAP